MSTVTEGRFGPNDAPASAPRASGVTVARVARSEWTKLWSLRSTRWSLLVAALIMVGIGPLFCLVLMGRWDTMGVEDQRHLDGIDKALVGFHLAPLAIGVLGVLMIAGEYSTGMIRSSLMAVPQRLPVLAAKVAVFASVTFVLMLIASLVGFLLAQPILAQHHVDVGLGDPGAIGAIVFSALFLALIAALTVGIGAIVRNAAGGIAVFAALVFVVPGLTNLLPATTRDAIAVYLPDRLGTAMATNTPTQELLERLPATLVLLGYVAITLLIAGVLLRRRDA